jgi:hypothetical protein
MMYNNTMVNFDPAEYNYTLGTSYVENQDAQTIFVKEFIDDNIKNFIYDDVKDKKHEDGIYQPFVGHLAHAIHNPKIKNILNVKVNQIAKLNNLLKEGESLVLTECSFATYSPKYGNKPKLFPHFDTHAIDGQRITVDIQLNSNISWAVVVEGNKFTMDLKDAILFYGTQQMHWREKRDNFNAEDFTDMLFCHFAFSPKKEWSDNQKEILEYRSHRLCNLLGISNQPESFDIIDMEKL